MYVLRRLFLEIFLPAFCVLGIAYNLLILINGSEGVRAHDMIKERLLEERQAYHGVVTERQRLEQRVVMLSRNSLDPDLLDENARKVLGYADPGDYVISMDELDRLLAQ